ncbi:hypothetical protein [Bellilinea sp.]|uniref:hypothetical protein n=1 Tax=Bellilinea sp. TaxID=2838785 RepID=UPI002ADE132D|nr:hypothetical protein [Bellilinea sp.]
MPAAIDHSGKIEGMYRLKQPCSMENSPTPLRAKEIEELGESRIQPRFFLHPRKQILAKSKKKYIENNTRKRIRRSHVPESVAIPN